MFLDTNFLERDEIKLILEKTTEADPVKNWVPAYHFWNYIRSILVVSFSCINGGTRILKLSRITLMVKRAIN